MTSAHNPVSDATGDTAAKQPKDVSPNKKTARATNEDDASTRLPPNHFNCERESPGQLRKTSGSGKGKRKAPGPDGIPAGDVFLAAAAIATSPQACFALNALGTPQRRRGAHAQGQSESPTPSRRGIGEVDTGHHATDVSNLEEGQIPESLPLPTGVDDTADEADDEGGLTLATPIAAPTSATAPRAPAAVALAPQAEEADAPQAPTADAPQAAAADPHAATMSDIEENTPTMVDEGQAPHVMHNAPAAAEPMQVDEPAQDPAGPGHMFIFEDDEQAAAHTAQVAQNAVGVQQVAALGPVGVAIVQAGMAAQPPRKCERSRAANAIGLIVNDFDFPDIKAHAEAAPTDTHLNPHRKIPAYDQVDPARPWDVGKVNIVQPNTGDWDHMVISQADIEENVHPSILEKIHEKPEKHILAIQFLGGKHFTERMADSAAALTDAAASRSSLSSAKYAQGKGPSRHAGPFFLLIRFTSADAREEARAKQLFAKDRYNAWAIIVPEDCEMPWMACAFKPSFGENTAEARVALRGGTIVHGYYAFTSLVKPENAAVGPRCIICKQDTHFASACPFRDDPLWWGPKQQINKMTEGPLVPTGGRGRGSGRAGFGGCATRSTRGARGAQGHGK
ncbi:hypothetical protein B0H17DRAFT_1134635 [Mycena rosella]|uniref:Uncharacterized protein n=1 Tax=Mycena rosella TaxID=1033263 RepID=A0AAD7GIS3_MYCRO|nr:hypothetical protein B0H17DRAFT_1134635 [Mycena rosella]